MIGFDDTLSSSGNFMKKEILISSTQLETRVAILEKRSANDSVLVDFFIDRPNKQKIVGNVYKGKVVNVLAGLNSAFVNIGTGKNAYLQVDDVIPKTKRIQEILKPNMDILVQVTKDSIGTKGPKLTMDISLAGRFLVLMPFSQKFGVSKNITDKNRRTYLKNIVKESIKARKLTYGAIVRTEAEDASDDEIRDEIRYLEKLFKTVVNKYKQSSAPKVVYFDSDIVEQIIRDYFTDEVELLLTDSQEVFKDAIDYTSNVAPELLDRIKLYKGKTPLFTAFAIDRQIESLLQPKVKLPTGGYIVMQEAESLCAIDVNSGSFLGNSLEDTATKTNIAAAYEIARQLRLRNIGGIVVIDFIDMKNRSSQKKVLEALRDAVKDDKAKIKIFPVTNLGLIEMSRSRKTSSLRSFLGESCKVCNGSGIVMSRYSILVKVNSDLEKLTQRTKGGYRIKIKLNPDIAEYFIANKDKLSADVDIIKDDSLSVEEYQIILI